MPDQPEEPKSPAEPLPAGSETKTDDSQYNVAEQSSAPRAMPDYLKRHLDAADRKLAEEKVEGTGKGTVPFSPTTASQRCPRELGQALLRFLTRPSTIAAWVCITSCLLFVGCFLYLTSLEGSVGYFALLGVYVIFLPVMLGVGYVLTCMLKIIENMLHGIEAIEPLSNVSVVEWVVNLCYFAALMIPAIVLGFIVGMLTPVSSGLAYVVSVYIFAPVLLLGSFFADGAWVPLALPSVLRSMGKFRRDWLIFYAEIAALLVVGIVIRAISLYVPSWLGGVLSYPLFGLVILIYSFLLGRMARWMAAGQGEAAAAEEEEEP